MAEQGDQKIEPPKKDLSDVPMPPPFTPRKNLTPEQRQKLSEIAKKRHREGKFGGPVYGAMGGRARRNRVGKRVAQAAQDDRNARAIIEVLRDAVHPSQPMGIRLKGAELWLQIEREESKLALQEVSQEAMQHSRDELIALLGDKLTQGPVANILRRQIEENAGVVDAQVVDDDEEAA